MAVKPLTVDFHESGFLDKLNQENQFGFWFQLNAGEKEQTGSPWGPSNPQALNRYSYVQNNPLLYTDPSGHAGIIKECKCGSGGDGLGGRGGGGGGSGRDNRNPRTTEHAETRRSEGRPVGQAMPDAQKARLADVYIQPDGRYVVRGPNGREHIFLPNGQVHTSIRGRSNRAHTNLVMDGERRPVTEAEFQQFKELIR